MYELAFTSQQKEAKEFRKYCFNTLFPQIRQKLVDIDLESSNRRHQLAIEDMGREHQQAIEAKDTALAMLNDDLDESQREYAILEYKYEQLETRAVPYLEDPKKIIVWWLFKRIMVMNIHMWLYVVNKAM